MSAPLLELRGVGKQFAGVTVLRDVDLTVNTGEIHAVVGENGAGKSTLMKIVAGAHRPNTGEVQVAGEAVQFRHPLHAQQHGISIVYQELNLLPERTVAQNVFLGREPGRAWLVDNRQMERDTDALLGRLGVSDVIRPDARVGDLSVAAQQMVEIAKALSQDVRLLILDEPTAALAAAEVETLFGTLRELAAGGIGVLYVSHRLQEVFSLTSVVTVLKDGRLVTTRPTDTLDAHEVVSLMVGRELEHYFPDRAAATRGDAAALVVRGGGNERLHDIELELHPGEVVGLAGLAGSGRTRLVRALFGADPFTRGTVSVAGRPITIDSPRTAVALGIGYISEDRKGEGLVLGQGVPDNGLLPVRAMPPRVFAERVGSGVDAARRLDDTLRLVDLRAAAASAPVRHLSGGNQQKVVLAKWLVADSRVLLFDEPTTGIDVGARAGIHELIRTLANEGCAVLMVSSDLPEVIGMSDRIIVMHGGRIAGELRGGCTETDVMRLAVEGRRAVGVVA